MAAPATAASDAKEATAAAPAAASGDASSAASAQPVKSVTVPTTKVVEGAVRYVVAVVGTFNKWSISKRYSQFEELQTNVLTEMAGKTLPAGCELPPKKMKLFTTHTSPVFIEERRCLLEAYLKKVISVEKLAKADCVVRFLTSDKEGKEEPVAAAPAGAAAVEEKSSGDGHELPDDVEITGITIPATRTMTDHVLYQIDVCNSRKRKTFSKWTVLKRFGQFYEMDAALRESLIDNPDGLASLPGPPQRKAKLFNDHMDENFVEQRRVLLENFLNRLLEHPLAIRNKAFLSFLGVSV